jgi:molybdenum cofactor cytidylyltransferase
MGTSKQLLTINGKSLLANSVQLAKSASTRVVVVLGSEAERHRAALGPLEANVIVNEEWTKGMGSSLKAGIKKLCENPPEAVLIMACDQPAVTIAHLQAMIHAYFSLQKRVVATSYGSTAGVPVLFDWSLSEELHSIPDDGGAKGVIMKYVSELSTIPLAGGEIDLDTPEAYEEYKGKH